MTTKATTAVVEMDWMDSRIVDDDEVVVRSGHRQWADTIRPRTVPVPELYTQAQFLQSYAFEMHSVPSLETNSIKVFLQLAKCVPVSCETADIGA